MAKQLTKVKSILILLACDFVNVTLSVVFSLLIVNGSIGASWELLWWYLAELGTVLLFYLVFRVYFIVFASAGIIDTLKVISAVALILIVNVGYIFAFELVNLQVMITFVLLLAVMSLIPRFSKRFLISIKYALTKGMKDRVRTMIVGGGSAGTMLIREMQTTDKIDYLPICVVDDDESKIGWR